MLAPSPLAPLPRWGEGDRNLSDASRDKACRHRILWFLNNDGHDVGCRCAVTGGLT